MTNSTALCCPGIAFVLMAILSIPGSISAAVTDSSVYHPHSDIIKQAETFISQNIDPSEYTKIEISMGQLDSRLTLHKCPVSLQTQLSQGSQLNGKSTIHVKCNGAKPWTVFIGAQIKLYKDVIATARPLDRGHILTENDLQPIETELARLNQGYYSDKSSLIGQQLKRRLAQKKVIKANYISPPTLVKRSTLR